MHILWLVVGVAAACSDGSKGVTTPVASGECVVVDWTEVPKSRGELVAEFERHTGLDLSSVTVVDPVECPDTYLIRFISNGTVVRDTFSWLAIVGRNGEVSWSAGM